MGQPAEVFDVQFDEDDNGQSRPRAPDALAPRMVECRDEEEGLSFIAELQPQIVQRRDGRGKLTVRVVPNTWTVRTLHALKFTLPDEIELKKWRCDPELAHRFDVAIKAEKDPERRAMLIISRDATLAPHGLTHDYMVAYGEKRIAIHRRFVGKPLPKAVTVEHQAKLRELEHGETPKPLKKA